MKKIGIIINVLFLFVLFVQCETKSESTFKEQETTVLIDSTKSEITCPKCGAKETLTMPTDQCQIKYTCQSCKAESFPKDGDCCVFCTYGNHKCPSMQ